MASNDSGPAPPPVYRGFAYIVEEAQVATPSGEYDDNNNHGNSNGNPPAYIPPAPVDESVQSCEQVCPVSAAVNPYQTYPDRWYVLILYAVLGIAQNMVYSTISPIAPLAEPALGLTQTDISLLANWYNIMFVVGVFPYMYLVQIKGLRMPVASGAVFMCIGAFVRCLNTNNASPIFDKAMLHLGQAINGLAASVLWFACTKLSAVWFPPSERNISTSIGLVSGGFGVAISFVVGPYTVNGLATKWSGGGPPTLENIALAIRYLLYGEAIVCGMLCALTLFYFPSEPPTPPCYSAKSERFEFLKGLKQFAKNKDAWLIFFLYSISGSVLGGWTQFLAITVQNIMDNVTSGWLGFAITVAMCVSGPITSITAKWWFHYHPKLICAALLFVGASLTVVFWVATAFVPTLLTPALTWATLVTGALFITSCQPLWWEMCCEAVYPVPEQIVAGIFSLGSTIIAIIFFVLYSFPSLGTAWSNWFLALCESACVPLILFYSGKARRLADDQRALQQHQAAEVINQSEYTKLH